MKFQIMDSGSVLETEISIRNPWPELKSEIAGEDKNSFDDNFNDNFKPVSLDTNENGLQLPDSGHYLSVLERKLTRIQSQTLSCTDTKDRTNRAAAKEILKSLSVKRDAIFQHPEFDSQSFGCENFNETTDHADKVFSTLITNSALYNVLEKKITPHLHAIDAQELKRLLESDLLNLTCDIYSQIPVVQNKIDRIGDNEDLKKQ